MDVVVGEKLFLSRFGEGCTPFVKCSIKNMFSSRRRGGMEGGRKRGTERGEQGGPATCDRGLVWVGTRFVLNEDEETVDNEEALTRRGAMFSPL